MSSYSHNIVSPDSTISAISSTSSSTESLPHTLKFPFKLDPFQVASIAAIHKNHSVLVSAPTSSGKTVVAEAAIDDALHHQQRIIYTSPIKALTNQKYRQLSADFGGTNVGLITGDVTLNSTAQCLVMTTEVLRGMLYQRNSLLRDLRYVVCDEVHYLAEPNRGVVWEEVIILLNKSVKLVLLSATVPNAVQLAQWVAKIKQHQVDVISTNHRAVPLNHYLYSGINRSTHLVVNEQGKFNKMQFNKATGAEDSDSMHKRYMAPGEEIGQIVELIARQHYEPAIVFSFSKLQCDNLAWMMSNHDFVTSEERSKIVSFFDKAMKNLHPDDQDLPHVRRILPLLKNGIGMHHAGLLPIIKELVEILFAEGLLKVLFATETFAMGVNAPVQTVIFTNVYKYDGAMYRPLHASEYIQMAGRAGRRGYDDRGTIIMMVDRNLAPGDAKSMIKGEAMPLVSAFKFKNSGMLLNAARVQGLSADKMLQMSFHTFQQGGEATMADIGAMDALAEKLADVDVNSDWESEEYDGFEDLAAQLLANDTPLSQLAVRKEALTGLGYLDGDKLLTKGQLAKEISSGDGVLITELIFDGELDTMSPQQVAVLLAYFVDAESLRQKPLLGVETRKIYNRVHRVAEYVAMHTNDYSYDENVATKNFRLLFMQMVWEWCDGRSFKYLTEMSSVFEGSIVRAFKHLQQLLRELSDAARWTADPELKGKLKEASQLINRPGSILTCPSIYLSL
ncbi:hypothetical protein E3P99_02303 [Wallemia hederae]|uniref:Helicase ATP-binding domain-containing protein n=1 Tax=Wallemia hederae TaxID=1540922 RepID=A0A4T0FKR8_9BASI|nr:hypothetical protein E3P99_02303 [Wallemia hederae]